MNLLGGTKIYAVYARPGKQEDEHPVLVKEGFNLFAFLFTVFWALYHRLWKVVFYIIAFNIGLGMVTKAGMLTEPSVFVMQLAFQVFIGFQANDWRQTKLQKKGYVLSDIAVADSPLQAEQRYFEKMLATG